MNLEYQKVLFENLSNKDIGKPILLINKGEREYAILVSIDYNTKLIEVHFGRNEGTLLSNCENFYFVTITN